MATLLGIALVTAAGLGTGTVMWPMKLMRRLEFEHYWFLAMFLGLFIIPWTWVLICVPHAFSAYASVGWEPLLIANLFAFAWGVANVLYAMAVERIGAALTGAIMTGLSVMAGTTLPLVMKGTGLFSNAPDLDSASGKMIMISLAIMLLGVLFSLRAGFLRSKTLKEHAGTTAGESQARKPSGSFLSGLLMAIIAGPTSAGSALCFVYGQGPIVTAMKAQGAGELTSNIAVWAAALLCGTAVNIFFPAYLMTKKKNWHVLFENLPEALLACVIGIQFICAVTFLGRGMLMLGILGASVGFGIQQTTQIMGNLGVGFISGEWKGIHGRPRMLLYIAIAILLSAMLVMAYSNNLASPASH